MQRFFLPPGCFIDEQVVFPPEISHQISRVLRYATGDEVIALDNQGGEYHVRLEIVHPSRSEGRIIYHDEARGEPKTRITLWTCLTRREKFEWVLQKCTEAGVGAFFPLVSSRSLVQNLAEAEEKRPRWENIIREAAEQSGRGRIPDLLHATHLHNALSQPPTDDGLRLLLEEGVGIAPLRSVLRNFKGTAFHLLSGPEGGFTDEEVRLAIAAGFKPASLGARTMRMETAALAAVLLVLYELDDTG
jgi:16S rRNA (uracil1498-N3)-methyltransferase